MKGQKRPDEHKNKNRGFNRFPNRSNNYNNNNGMRKQSSNGNRGGRNGGGGGGNSGGRAGNSFGRDGNRGGRGGNYIYNSYQNEYFDYKEIEENTDVLQEPSLPKVVTPAMPFSTQPPPSILEESTPKEPVKNIKSEKRLPPPTNKVSDGISERADPKPSISLKTEEKQKTIPDKRTEKNVPITETKKAAPVTSSSSSSSSSSSDDSSSSSEESTSKNVEIPKMPNPIKVADPKVLFKKEKESKNDVIYLGEPSNFESLISDEEDCLVCNNKGHSSVKCQTQCTKCNQSLYEKIVRCKNCGETYPKSLKVDKTNEIIPSNPPNPFMMFMQFMQFCMQQYGEYTSEMCQAVPGPMPVQGPSQQFEVTRQDIANTKHERKSSSRKSRKKRKMEKKSESESDSNSDSSFKANSSMRKRRKQEIAPATPTSNVSQQQSMPPFAGLFDANPPFNTGGFNAAAFNPMLAFTQMMGYNPPAMHFPQ